MSTSKLEYGQFLKSQFAAFFLNFKIAGLILLIVTLLLLILFGTHLAIGYYYPESSSLLNDKHSPFIVLYFIFFISLLVAIAPFLLLFAFKITEYEIKQLRQQAQEKIVGVARIDIDRSNRKETLFYVTVPDRCGKLWYFRFVTGSFFVDIKEGEFPAEIYFREAIDSPAFVEIKRTTKETELLVPDNAPQCGDAPIAPAPNPLRAFCFLEIIFYLVSCFLS